MSRYRHVGVVVASATALASCLGVFVFACASGEPPRPSVLADAGDGASDAGPDAAEDAGVVDAAVDAGDGCGDVRGLEPNAPWPLVGGCPKRGGMAAFAGPRSASVRWSVPLSSRATSPVLSASGLVWVGTADGLLACASDDGSVVASVDVGGAASSPTLTAARIVEVGSADGHLYGVVLDEAADGGVAQADAGAPEDAGDAGDAEAEASDGGPDGGVVGRVVFRTEIGPTQASPVCAGDGTTFVGTTDGKLVATTPDGAVRWSVSTHDALGASPAIGRTGLVYVGSSDHHVYAISQDGAVAWTFETTSAVTGSPAVYRDESVVVGTEDGTVYSLEPSGALRWTFRAGGPLAVAFGDGVVYVGAGDKQLYALDVLTGSKLWAFATLGAVASPVVAADGTVYAGSADGHLYAVTPKGNLFFAVNVRGSVTTAPALGADGTLYITTDRALVAVGP